MKLEKGMYVRTSKGKIRKFEGNNSMARVPFMIKCSYNIIDLIEIGDYVNGKKVDRISFIEDTYYIKTKVSNTNNYDYLPEHLIETILTKEQYEKNCYRIEE